MFLACLGAALVVAFVVQLLVFAADWLYEDDNSWLIAGLSIFVLIGLAIQAVATGIVSAAIIAAIPDILLMALILYGGSTRYDTKNPVKVLISLTRESWACSKAVQRVRQGIFESFVRLKTVWHTAYNRGFSAQTC